MINHYNHHFLYPKSSPYFQSQMLPGCSTLTQLHCILIGQTRHPFFGRLYFSKQLLCISTIWTTMHDILEIIANNCHISTVIWTIWVDFQTRMEPAFCHLLLCVIRKEVLHGLEGGSQMAGVFHGNSQCQFHFLVCKCLEVSFHHIWEHN